MKKYDKEFKKEAVKKYLDGQSVASILREIGAGEGNQKVIFGLRRMKTNIGDPHRNFVDFAHVPVVKHLTRMPDCIDPSHSVGLRSKRRGRHS